MVTVMAYKLCLSNCSGVYETSGRPQSVTFTVACNITHPGWNFGCEEKQSTRWENL